MRKIKGRGILVMCLFLFGGYAFYDFQKQRSASEKQTADAKIFAMNVDQIDAIEIQKDGQTVEIKRGVDGWTLLQPLKDSADDAAAEDLIKMTSAEKIKDVAKEGADIDWASFGLDKPAASFTFTNSAGQKGTLHVSAKFNFEGHPFARRDQENRVLIVNSSWATRAEMPIVEFRDRRFLRHKMGAIDTFKLKNKNGIVDIALKDGKWVDAGSKKMELDQQKVREIFRGIADAKGANYVDGKMPALQNLFTLDMKLGDKNWKAEVGQAADKKIYAKVSDPAFQMQMAPGAVDKLIELKTEDLKVGATPKDDKGQAQLAHEPGA
ncbi:DUF4340 domain-containing protein [Bdellovibrio sp. HCB209]|uniref:DUF4340 domain-containing protein n=1 Tax=Bdellovibrio sp. HCB209 TaxID=3394354 RepID=UPI0039B66AE9